MRSEEVPILAQNRQFYASSVCKLQVKSPAWHGFGCLHDCTVGLMPSKQEPGEPLWGCCSASGMDIDVPNFVAGQGAPSAGVCSQTFMIMLSLGCVSRPSLAINLWFPDCYYVWPVAFVLTWLQILCRIIPALLSKGAYRKEMQIFCLQLCKSEFFFTQVTRWRGTISGRILWMFCTMVEVVALRDPYLKCSNMKHSFLLFVLWSWHTTNPWPVCDPRTSSSSVTSGWWDHGFNPWHGICSLPDVIPLVS